MAGYSVNLDALATFAGRVSDIHGTAQGVAKQYYQHVGAPQFGQNTGVVFEPAYTLAGTYDSALTAHQDSMSQFFAWILTMSDAATIIHKRYGTLEALSTASADDITKALQDAATQAAG